MEKNDMSCCMQNRELSWLKFNERVLEEADCGETPLLERLKFLSIFTSNLDEFFMVRVGSLSESVTFAPESIDNKTGMSPRQQLAEIFLRVAPLYELRDSYYSAVTRQLDEYGVSHSIISELDNKRQKKLEAHFVHNILPLLSPQIVDSRHPFPHMDNKRLHIVAALEKKTKLCFGIIALPQNMDRLIFLEEGKFRYVLLEELIYHFANMAFGMYNVHEKTIAAVTRNADIDTEEGFLDEDINYPQFMKKIIKKRTRLAPVRLELNNPAGETITGFLCEKLALQPAQTFFSDAPLELSYCYQLEGRLDGDLRDALVRPPFVPSNIRFPDKKTSLIKQVQKKDVLLSYPFESMLPFLAMLKQAAEDQTVLSIKITLYRIDSRSKLAEILLLAAENGKEVVVMMELRARFDENNNVEWAQRLEEAGCRVIYGPAGFKVHSKICLITKKELGKITYITHLGTGNYNEKTAKLYTDLSIITANQEIGKDAAAFFNNLLLGQLVDNYTHLWVAPNSYKNNLLRCIEEERAKAEKGEPGRIIIKCNSLTDREIIVKLVEASQSGVKISMIVRGICCIVPQIPEFTDNITVISIIGRFLEHTRIFSFGTGEKKKIYISSADLMTRNTERRLEIACPILAPDLKQQISDMLKTMLEDNTKAWELLADGSYLPRKNAPADIAVNSQEAFIEKACVPSQHTAGQNGTNTRKKGFWAWLKNKTGTA
jgi:polyphosphate kinase